MEPSFKSINPATGAAFAHYPFLKNSELEAKLRNAVDTATQWRSSSFTDRKTLLLALADRLRDREEELAKLMSQEMGKPVTEARAEVKKCVRVCVYYAEQGEAFLSPDDVPTDAHKSYIAYQPLGVLLAIMPWNFPLWQVFRFAAPAIMAGNVVLLKHAPNVPGCATAIESLFKEAQAPAGLLQNLFIRIAELQNLIQHPEVAAVSLTGSSLAGRSTAELAGKALKKCVLELGGSDPYLVLEDADLDLAAEKCFISRFLNAGQSCIAAKRLIVVESVREAFEEKLRTHIQGLVMGNPAESETTLGPLAREDLRSTLQRQVEDTVGAGAQLLCGGVIPEGPGYFYPPTLLTEVKAPMTAAVEELFGPVACIFPVQNEAEAIEVANDTPFGLGAAVFTSDLERGERIARDLLFAGSVAVNDFVRSDPRLPIGGTRNSGYGRELGRAGLLEFVNIKSVVIGQ